MKLSNLENIYRNIKAENETYYIFPFEKNGVKFEILFNIIETPFELHFLQKLSNFSFKVNVDKGFEINPNLDKVDYKNLCNALGLKYDANNKFSTYSFFQEFNNLIPNYKKRRIVEHELLQFYKSNFEESDKIYYLSKKEWNKYEGEKNVSKANLEKTKILYPELYNYCKRENVSILYTSKKL